VIDLGRTIRATDTPAKPPYKSTSLWRGEDGDWRLEAVRIEGDPVPHCTAHNTRTGIAHAERIEDASPAKIKVWAESLPCQAATPAEKANAA
jgi:hypothetical protein